MSLDDWFKRLTRYAGPGVFNPWRQRNPFDLATDGPKKRRTRLARHLDNPDARLLMVGEASGHQGAKYSGVPFTSERLLLEGRIPGLENDAGRRISSRPRPFSEPSATTVWGAAAELGIAHRIVLWNAFPWHPCGKTPDSNRTPTRTELEQGLIFLEGLVGHFPRVTVVAIGRKAEASLQRLGLRHTMVRHPSMGGAPAFRQGLRKLARGR